MTLKWPLALVAPHPYSLPYPSSLSPSPPSRFADLAALKFMVILLPQLPKCCLCQQTCPFTADLVIFLLFCFRVNIFLIHSAISEPAPPFCSE